MVAQFSSPSGKTFEPTSVGPLAKRDKEKKQKKIVVNREKDNKRAAISHLLGRVYPEIIR